MMTARSFLASILSIGAAGCVSAQAGGGVRPIDLFDLGAPSFTTFSPRDGVPDSVIVSVQTDRDGFVWLASSQGLARYDGRRWNTAKPLTTTGSIGQLLVDHEGTLRASFRDRGVARFDGGQWRFTDRDSLPSEHIRRLTETVDAHGRYELWAPTFDKGLLQFDGTRWLPAPNNAQLPIGVLAVARTHVLGGHERLWAGTFNEGLWYREDGDWKRLRTPQFDPAQIEYLLDTEHDGREELWISAFGNGLWRLDDSGWRCWSIASGDLPTNELYDIAQSRLPDGDRALWIASRSGLIRLHNDRAETFDRRHGLPSNVVRSVSVWRSPEGIDVLWLATEAGVARTVIGASQWQIASLMGAGSVGVFGLLVEPDGSGGERLWVASSGDGLGLYEKGRWRTFTQTDGALPDSEVRMIKRAPGENGEQELWLGERYGYLMRVHDDGPRFEAIETPWERHPGQAVMDVLSRKVSGHFERWFATRQSGVYRWRDNQWTAFRPADAIGQWRTNRLIEQVDRSGRSWLWASSNQGLARFDGERWTLLGAEIGLPDPGLSGASLIPDSDGRPVLWIGTGTRGVVRVAIDDPMHPYVVAEALPPPPDPTAYGALADSKGVVYICTNAGVQVLRPTPGGYASQAYARGDGLVHEECNTNAQIIDVHDRFWTGMLGGVSVFDPQATMRDTTAKPLKLTQARVDGEPVDTRSIRLTRASRELHIEYALLAWQHETQTRFRTQLLGYEDAPGTWTTDNYRNFNALPTGDYLLRIEGRDYAGNFSTPIEVRIEVVPAWWQHRWVAGAGVLCAALATFGLVRWRTRMLKAQRVVLEDEVAERTAELHAVNARLRELSYRDALTGISNRRALLEALQTAISRPATATLVFVDVDRFKDYNDHFGHPAGDEALCRVAHAMLECAPANALVARYGGEEFACLLLDADTSQGIQLAECFRATVEAIGVPIPGTAVINHVTISAGVATCTIASEDDAHRLLREADNALYYAKNDGRNCVRA